MSVNTGSQEVFPDISDIIRGNVDAPLEEHWVENELSIECDLLSNITLTKESSKPPSGDSTNSFKVTKEGVSDGIGAFYLVTTGDIQQGESEAVIEGTAALDWVGPQRGVDSVQYTGDSEHFLVKGSAALYLNGERRHPDEFGSTGASGGSLPNSLTVESTGTGLGAFGLTVTGQVGNTSESEAVTDGTSALDWVGPERGSDTVRFSGGIEQFLLKGDAIVYLNGDRVDPASL